MSNNKEMIPEEVEAELKFAMEHGLSIDKHDMTLLNVLEARAIAQKLSVRVSLEATFLDNRRAYYVMQFGNFATYFGRDLVTSDDNYTYDPVLEAQVEMEI